MAVKCKGIPEKTICKMIKKRGAIKTAAYLKDNHGYSPDNALSLVKRLKEEL